MKNLWYRKDFIPWEDVVPTSQLVTFQSTSDNKKDKYKPTGQVQAALDRVHQQATDEPVKSVHSTASITVLDPGDKIVYSKRNRVHNSHSSSVQVRTSERNSIGARPKKSTTDAKRRYNTASTVNSRLSTAGPKYSTANYGTRDDTRYLQEIYIKLLISFSYTQGFFWGIYVMG